MTKLQQCTNLGDRISITWQDGLQDIFHAIWLRDNCHCQQCGDPAIGRRTLRLSDLDLAVTIQFLQLGEADQLEITWSDNHQGLFKYSWLRQHSYGDTPRKHPTYQYSLWSEDFRNNVPAFEFNEVMGSPEALFEVLRVVRDHGLCYLKQAPLQSGALETFARMIGYPQESNFGCLQDLVIDKGKRSIANDVTALKPHTDEPYRASPPGILMFHCIETDVTGAGESIFVDGFAAAEQLRAEDAEGFKAITTNNQPFRRYFEGDVDLSTSFPVISVDKNNYITGVRINDRVAAPVSVDSNQIPQYYRGMQILLRFTEDKTNWIKHKLSPGDIAIFDNHRILHGRTRLSLNARRWLQWLQIERGDFHSTLRILSDKLHKPRDDLPFSRGAYS
jgi:gamma-butyrobetaine dioxygenase